MSREQELETALVRLLTGINKENGTIGCEYYDGLEEDAVVEAYALLKDRPTLDENMKEVLKIHPREVLLLLRNGSCIINVNGQDHYLEE